MATEVLSSICSTNTWNNVFTSGDRALYANHYTTSTAWEAACGGCGTANNGDLVGANQIAVSEVVSSAITGDAADNINFDFGVMDMSGWVSMDATHYAIIRAKTGHKFNPVTMTGAKINGTGTSAYGFVVRAGHRLHVKDVKVEGPSVSAQFVYNSVDEFVFENCVITNVLSGNCSGVSTTRAINCLIIPTYYSADIIGLAIGGCELDNCTIIQKTGMGGWGGDIATYSCTCKNTVVYNENTKASYGSYFSSALTNCAQNNNGSTALSAPSINGILTSDFTNYAAGDYSLSATSALKEAGTTVSGYTTDIIGTVRS